MRKLLRQTLLIFSGCVVGLLVGEVGLRLLGLLREVDYGVYAQSLQNPTKNPREIYATTALYPALRAYAPNSEAVATTHDFSTLYKINSKGFRDKEYAYQRAGEAVRFVSLGDSFTFGSGVAYGKRFSDIPEAHFRNVEIINLGVQGWGVDQEVLLFMAEGIRYSPDYVIVFLNDVSTGRHGSGIYRRGALRIPPIIQQELQKNLEDLASGQLNASNYVASLADPSEVTRELRSPRGDRSTIYIGSQHAFFKAVPQWAMQHSRLISYFAYVVEIRSLRRSLAEQDEGFWAAIEKKLLAQSQKTGDTAQARLKSLYEERTMALLEELSRVCSQIGAKLLVVNIDATAQLAYLGRSPIFEYHDLQPIIARIDVREFKYDPHYNAETHAVIGSALIEYLATKIDLEE